MKKLTDCFNCLRSGAIHGFAGYGSAIAFDANSILAAQIGVIHGMALILMSSIIEYFGQKNVKISNEDWAEKFSCKNLAQLGIESVLVVACRTFNLVGNQGFLILGAVAVARFHVIRREYIDILSKMTN